MKIIKNLSLIGITLGMAACSQEAYVPDNVKPNEQPALNERTDITLTRAEQQTLSSQNTFAFNLFQTKSALDAETNTLISPISASTCLGMLSNGVTGPALDELLGVLLPEGGSLDDLNALIMTLAPALAEADNSTTLNLANSIWADNHISLKSDFLNRNATYFNASSASIDMFSAAAADMINGWVNETTNGLISRIYNGAPMTDLTLINTMYYKGSWVTPFDAKNTVKTTFRNADGSVSETEMMNVTISQAFFEENNSYKAVGMPYGNHAYSFYAILPDEGTSLDSFIKTFDSEKWKEIKKALYPTYDVKVSLPKFSVNYSWDDMKATLSAMGVKRLFSDNGSLSGICDKTLDASSMSVKQTSVFSVDEKGAEGASETHIDIFTSSGTPSVPRENIIELNRPFLYLIEEQSTGAIIFIGKFGKI